MKSRTLFAVVLLVAAGGCSSKDGVQTDAAIDVLAGTGGATTGSGGATGGMLGTGGGVGGAQVSGTGGHDIAPVMCGTAMCSFGLQCCHGCNGSTTCAGVCPAVACALDAGADAVGGAIPCGDTTCGPQEACVHPPRGGTCMMPDAGACPPGTSVEGNCCVPLDKPTCVTPDRPCEGPTVTCACFSKDPCGAACAGSLIKGRDLVCGSA